MNPKLRKLYIGARALWQLNVRRDPGSFLAPTMVILLSDRCNYRCVTCHCYEIGDKTRELTLAQWLTVLEDYRALGGLSVRFTGGEAFLRKRDFYQLVDWLNAHGMVAKLSTNGSLIRADDIAEIKERHLDVVEISLHGREKNHEDYVRIPGSQRRTVELLNTLIKEGLPARIAFTIIKSNIGDIEYIVDLARELGITVSFNILDNHLYYFKDLDASIFPTAEEMRLASDTLIALKRRHPAAINGTVEHFAAIPRLYGDSRMREYFCARTLMNIYLDSFGNLYHGCWAMKPSGNVAQGGLKDILESREYRDCRRAGFLKQCPGCTCGYQMDFALNLIKRAVPPAPGA